MAKRRSRTDRNGVGMGHLDKGCSYHPKCLTCPLALCKHDMEGGLAAAILLTEKIAEEQIRRASLGRDQISAAHAIIALVAEDYGVTVTALEGPKRERHLCQARREAYRQLRLNLNMTLEGIVRMLNRDHSTVIYGLRQVGAA